MERQLVSALLRLSSSLRFFWHCVTGLSNNTTNLTTYSAVMPLLSQVRFLSESIFPLLSILCPIYWQADEENPKESFPDFPALTNPVWLLLLTVGKSLGH